MTATEYLNALLASQTLEEDSQELKDLRTRRDEIEAVLRKEFGTSPKIRYAGSYAKGTLVKEAYDLDIVCYFPRDDADVGDTLQQIYEKVRKTLEKAYSVEAKPSAIRVKSREQVDFHVDVIPGRFIDEKTDDVFLYRSAGEKQRLKTNIEKHVAHVKDSGATDAIRIMKLWKTRNGVTTLKTFVLELLAIEVLKGSKAAVPDQVITALTKLRDEPEKIKIEDPANPSGNDLSELWNDSVRSVASTVAGSSLATIKSGGLEAAFGKLPEEKKDSVAKVEALRQAARVVPVPTRPWCR